MRHRQPTSAHAGTVTMDGTDGHAPPGFAELVNRFLDMANRANRSTPAPDVQITLLEAAARYSAFVAKTLQARDREAFIRDMSTRYAGMLRRHLDDPELE